MQTVDCLQNDTTFYDWVKHFQHVILLRHYLPSSCVLHLPLDPDSPEISRCIPLATS